LIENYQIARANSSAPSLASLGEFIGLGE